MHFLLKAYKACYGFFVKRQKTPLKELGSEFVESHSAKFLNQKKTTFDLNLLSFCI